MYIQYQNNQFFYRQFELFTSCNVSNNASLASVLTGRVDKQMWKGQGRGRRSQAFPNLCGHPLWMTSKVRNSINKISHQMWRNYTFIQRNNATKRAVAINIDVGSWIKFAKNEVEKIWVLLKHRG